MRQRKEQFPGVYWGGDWRKSDKKNYQDNILKQRSIH